MINGSKNEMRQSTENIEKSDKNNKLTQSPALGKLKNARLEEIPETLLLEIFSTLDVISLIRLGLVSKHFYHLSQQAMLWRALLNNDFPQIELPTGYLHYPKATYMMRYRKRVGYNDNAFIKYVDSFLIANDDNENRRALVKQFILSASSELTKILGDWWIVVRNSKKNYEIMANLIIQIKIRQEALNAFFKEFSTSYYYATYSLTEFSSVLNRFMAENDDEPLNQIILSYQMEREIDEDSADADILCERICLWLAARQLNDGLTDLSSASNRLVSSDVLNHMQLWCYKKFLQLSESLQHKYLHLWIEQGVMPEALWSEHLKGPVMAALLSENEFDEGNESEVSTIGDNCAKCLVPTTQLTQLYTLLEAKNKTTTLNSSDPQIITKEDEMMEVEGSMTSLSLSHSSFSKNNARL